jgi:hypothetical protein
MIILKQFFTGTAVRMLKHIYYIVPLIVSISQIGAQTIYFYESFNSGSAPYSFMSEFDGKSTSFDMWSDGSYWAEKHSTTGGWKNSGASHLKVKANESQFDFGWFTDGNFNGQAEWQNGDTVFIRFRIKFGPEYRWDGEGSQQNKMFLFGFGDNSRTILHNERPHPTSPCGLDPSQFLDGTVGGFALKRGITENCAGSVPVTFDVWYHVQLMVASCAPGQTSAEYRLWITGNDYDNPDSEYSSFTLTTDFWGDAWKLGGFWTDSVSRDSDWYLDDFTVADFFDDNWNPMPVSIAEYLGKLSTDNYYVSQNYPNPFNPTTTINYNLIDKRHVTLKIFDVLGREVQTLINRIQNAGHKSVKWNGLDKNGNAATSGVYIYTISAGNFIESRKMVLMK